jgi:hypothetical protein
MLKAVQVALAKRAHVVRSASEQIARRAVELIRHSQVALRVEQVAARLG